MTRRTGTAARPVTRPRSRSGRQPRCAPAAPLAAWLILLAGLVFGPGGCTVARFMASRQPGNVPRDGQMLPATAVGGEQVQFAFRFKAGPDPAPAGGSPAPADPNPPAPPDEVPLLAPEGPFPVRILAATLLDARGQPVRVLDQEVRRADNVYTVSVTSAAVDPESYRVVCQIRLAVGGHQLRLAGSATRELDRWRIEPRSFGFTVYNADQSVPWWQDSLWRWR